MPKTLFDRPIQSVTMVFLQKYICCKNTTVLYFTLSLYLPYDSLLEELSVDISGDPIFYHKGTNLAEKNNPNYFINIKKETCFHLANKLYIYLLLGVCLTYNSQLKDYPAHLPERPILQGEEKISGDKISC